MFIIRQERIVTSQKKVKKKASYNLQNIICTRSLVDILQLKQVLNFEFKLKHTLTGKQLSLAVSSRQR